MKNFMITALLTMLVMLLPLQAAPAQFQPDKIITYKQTPQGPLTLHIFEPNDHKPTDKSSCIVFFFGGSWNKGDPSHFYPQAAHYASKGIVSVCPDYRTKNRHGTEPLVCDTDAKSAIRWVRSHAGELGIDPNRIAASGGSAGGQVAASTGMTEAFNDPNDDKNISPKPAALILFNPVCDNGPPDGFGYERVKDYWQDFSPMNNINKNTPPTVIFLGKKDTLFPSAKAEEYRKLMAQAGVRCELYLYKGRTHGFFNYRNGENEDYYDTLEKTEKFLISIGFLSPEP